jgi:LysR family glycine cleavage system transcriptional activator
MRLPPLNALRAFEAAARHESFVKAANELNVTQGAVSRHVKLLEEHLGLLLFRRLPHGIELTPQGRTLLPELTASFERIAGATRQLAENDRELKVGCPPTLASRWLVRRLARFQQARPDLRVTLGIACGQAEFVQGGFDLGILEFKHDGTRPTRLDAVFLRWERMTPVCTPAVAQSLRKPEELCRQTLLHPNPDRADWLRWTRFAGLPDQLALRGGHVFETLEMATSAAAGGLGVAMLDLHLIGEELRSGVLVAPFDLAVREQTGYLLISGHGRFGEPKVAAFRDWLLAELAADGIGWPEVGRE